MANLKATESTAPSAGAYAWLKKCQSSDSVANDFYRNIVRPRIEADRKRTNDMADDGREILKKIENLITAFKGRKEV